jgi:lipase
MSGPAGTITAMSTLHHTAHGPPDGRPVLALHGVTGHAARWRVLAAALPELRFIAVDLRGHGRSPWHPPWHLEQHVADALAVLDELEVPRVILLGHSFGGTIALHLARAAAERVEQLVLLDPAIGLDAADMLAAAEEIRADECYPDRAAARADRRQRWPGVPDELVEAELTEHLIRDGDRWRYRYCRAAVVVAWSEMARPALIPPARLPTLLLPAAQADYVDPAWVRACRAALGDRLTVCEIDAGHLLYLERPAQVAEQIRAFLREGADG